MPAWAGISGEAYEEDKGRGAAAASCCSLDADFLDSLHSTRGIDEGNRRLAFDDFDGGFDFTGIVDAYKNINRVWQSGVPVDFVPEDDGVEEEGVEEEVEDLDAALAAFLSASPSEDEDALCWVTSRRSTRSLEADFSLEVVCGAVCAEKETPWPEHTRGLLLGSGRCSTAVMLGWMMSNDKP